MFRYQFSRLKTYAAPIALAVVFLSGAHVFAQKQQVVSAASAPLTLSLISDANIVRACDNSGAPQVQLTAKAVSPGGNPIKYKWTTTDGTIIGEGPVVTWNLAGLKPGYHKASLDIQSVGNDGTCQAFSSVSVLVNACAEVKPVCPAIEISCPTNVALDQPLTFNSRYSGGVPANITPVYNWTVSAGTIIEGQGTVAVEILEEESNIDYLFVPVGGGGLSAGVGTYFKTFSPQTKIIGVEPEALLQCIMPSKQVILLRWIILKHLWMELR